MGLFAVKALAVIRSAVGPLYRWLKSRQAEKSAAEAPGKLKAQDQVIFDDVLRRLSAADPADSIFTHTYDAVISRFCTPEFLRSRNVQDWLRKPSVRSDLRLIASAIALGNAAPRDAEERLETKYGEIALASLQESAPVVASISAMLAAAINARVMDQGTAALVTASHKESARSLELIQAQLSALTHSGVGEPSTNVVLTELDDETKNIWRDAFRAASRGLLRWPSTLDDGNHIARPELEQLLSAVNSDKSGTVALLGLPGSGKSALLARLGLELADEQNATVLAIKGDLLDASIVTEEDLQRELQLPELPSIMLRRLALAGPTVLLIDQLDALAGHLDTNTGRLSVLLNLIKAVCDTEGMHVFVSCRTFEFTHDIRISRIDAESVSLELPSWETVLPILEAHGVQAGGWNSDSREVVRVPQQLNTYLQLKASGVDEPFSNYTAMLDCLWSSRVLEVSGGGKAAHLAFEIADAMANMETLWLAKARFDDRAEDIKLLMSSGILTESEQGAIGFSHQTIFEHVLARSFAKSYGQLSAYVLARNDSLFVRPKLWAALAYLRNVEPATYEAELSTIWSAQDLRKHLRFLLIEFMGSQPSPSDKEELLLAAASENSELHALVLNAITGSQGWFERFGDNVIAQAMENAITADLCIQLLVAAWPHSPKEVTNLLRNVWLPNLDNDRRLLFVLQEAPVWSFELIETAKTVARRAQCSDLYFDHFISVIGSAAPKVAIELTRLIFDGELARRKAQGLKLKAISGKEGPDEAEAGILWEMEHNPTRPVDNFLNESQLWSFLPELAAAAPSHFVSVLWPWYLESLRALLELSRADAPFLTYLLPYSADFRFAGENTSSLEPSAILEAITVAIERLADTSTQELQKWGAEQAAVALAPVQRLIAHGLARNPSQTASIALNFLLEDERRYFLGNASHLYSTSLALITACAPHWSSQEVERFATQVKAFSPQRPQGNKTDPADSRQWYLYIRATRINLLRALPMPVRPSAIQREIEEEDRRYPHHREFESFEGGFIGSPMAEQQMSRASNDDIVNAFREIPDESDWDHPKDFRRGGNIQLARAFAEFSKEHPERSLEVIRHLEPHFGQRAAGYALEALAESYSAVDIMELIVQLQDRGFGDDQFKASVARAVDCLFRRKVIISEPVLVMLEGWVPVHETVSTQEDAVSEQSKEDSEVEAKGFDFLLSGQPRIEPVLSGDYPIITAIINARLARNEVSLVIQLLRRYLSLSQDKRVWGMLMTSMSSIPSMDSHGGSALIGDVLSLSQLDGSYGAAFLMASTHRDALNEVMSNLGRWRNSNHLAARIGYGELVTLIALSNKGGRLAMEWLNELVEDAALAEARVGAAATAVQLFWPEPRFRADATDLLLRLLVRNEQAIWQEVFKLFGLVDKLESESHTIRLLSHIAENIAHAPPPKDSFVVERLGALLPRHASVVARIASQLIQLWRDQLSNVGSAITLAAQEIMDLAITLHRTEGTRLEGLQMFEQLIEIDAYQTRAVLDELDHRIRPGARPLRRRPPRKARRRSRRV